MVGEMDQGAHGFLKAPVGNRKKPPTPHPPKESKFHCHVVWAVVIPAGGLNSGESRL